MFPGLADWIKMLLAFAVSLLVAYVMTPPGKRFAEKVGAIDVPRDNRRVHDHPIPRMGGLAIFIGFVLSLIFFVPMSTRCWDFLSVRSSSRSWAALTISSVSTPG